MAANSAFRITELDPDQIKQNFINYLKGQTEFTDYAFEGSGMNILLDLFAQHAHFLAFYTNMLGSEAYLDTAQLRSSAISHAKHIGYVPSSMAPAISIVDVQITPDSTEDQVAQTLILPRWTKFIGESVDGTNYGFVAINANNTTKQDGSFSFSNVVLKQAEVQSRIFVADSNNPKREYYIPSANVDIGELYVTVQESSSNTSFEIYNRFDDITELRSNSQVFFVEESTSGNGAYKIFFGDGYLGKKPQNGNIITITYLDTQGDYGNGANSFVLLESVNGFSKNVAITTRSPSAGGAKQETIDEIRYRAPIAYTTQNRAVNANDYKSLLSKDYPNIQSISVWGGDEESPPQYGKLFISLKPVNNYYITNIEKERIIDDLIKNRSVMTVIPEIINPDYTYIISRIKVYYDLNKTNLDENQLKSIVRSAVLQFRNDRLQQFDAKFRLSNLQRYIENADPSITSCSINLFLQKRIIPTLNQKKNYEIDFRIPLGKGLNENKLYTYPEIKVFDKDHVLRSCFIEEVPLSFTGIDSIRVVNSGQDYEDAIVTILGDGAGANASARIVNKKIHEINVDTRGANYIQASVAITSNTGYGATATAELQYNNGTLRLYYYKDNGEKVIINDDIGTINYKTGKINLNDLSIESLVTNPNYNFDIFTVNINPFDADISPVRNAILDLDENDGSSIKITMVAE